MVDIKEIKSHNVLLSYKNGKWLIEDLQFDLYTYEKGERLLDEYLEDVRNLVDLYGSDVENRLDPDAIDLNNTVKEFIDYDQIN